MSIRYVGIEGAGDIDGGVAVVIDVMRAFTVAAWALHLGATNVLPVDSIDDALSLADELPDALLVKDGAPDARFHLANSPRQLLNTKVSGHTIIQRTTSGTRAAIAARRADRLFCASFVCASATAKFVREIGDPHITLVASGGLDAAEDVACAEYIAATLSGIPRRPGPFIERAHTSAAAAELGRAVELGYTGVAREDVPMCLDVDRFAFAMEATEIDGRLTLCATR